jgi:hypothetical protein
MIFAENKFRHQGKKQEVEELTFFTPPTSKKSPWWNMFHEIEGGGKAVCNSCGSVFAALNTTTLKSHCKRSHEEVYESLIKVDRSINATEVSKKKSKPNTHKQTILSFANGATKDLLTQNFRSLMTRWFIAKSIPLNALNHMLVDKAMVAAVQAGKAGANFSISVEQMRNMIIHMYLTAKEKMKKFLANKTVTITTDHWTSRVNQAYSTLTVHFIEDDCELRAHVLDMCPFFGKTTADCLVEDFMQKLKYWGLEVSNVHFVVTDTEAKMNSFGAMIEKQFGIQHMYCINHLLQLVANIVYKSKLGVRDSVDVEDGGDGGDKSVDHEANREGILNTPPPPNDDVLKLARAIVNYISNSSQALALFKQVQTKLQNSRQPLSLVKDVETRWWSTFAMIERLVLLKDSIGHYFHFFYGSGKSGSKSAPNGNVLRTFTHEEWELLQDVQQLLCPLKQAQLMLEGSKYVTSSQVPLILRMIYEKLTRVKNSGTKRDVVSLAAKMLVKFEGCFGDTIECMFQTTVARAKGNRQVGINKALLLASACDPRWKRLSQFSQKCVEDVWYELLAQMKELSPAAECVEHSSRVIIPSSPLGLAPIGSTLSPGLQAIMEGYDSDTDEEVGVGGTSQAVHDKHLKTELDAYRRFSTGISDECKKSSATLQKDIAARGEKEKWTRETIIEQQQKVSHQNLKLQYDVLEWWKNHRRQFPNVWKVAQIVLAIPATSASSERSFSLAGHIIAPKRNRLDTKLVRKMHFLKENDWLLTDDLDRAVLQKALED